LVGDTLFQPFGVQGTEKMIWLTVGRDVKDQEEYPCCVHERQFVGQGCDS